MSAGMLRVVCALGMLASACGSIAWTAAFWLDDVCLRGIGPCSSGDARSPMFVDHVADIAWCVARVIAACSLSIVVYALNKPKEAD